MDRNHIRTEHMQGLDIESCIYTLCKLCHIMRNFSQLLDLHIS